jgi:hypothetical protein
MTSDIKPGDVTKHVYECLDGHHVHLRDITTANPAFGNPFVIYDPQVLGPGWYIIAGLSKGTYNYDRLIAKYPNAHEEGIQYTWMRAENTEDARANNVAPDFYLTDEFIKIAGPFETEQLALVHLKFLFLTPEFKKE